MRKPFETQPALFVSSTMLDHPSLHGLDDTEAVLDWTKLESLMDEIYASKTGCPSYPLLTLLSPEIVDMILDGRQSTSMALKSLLKGFPKRPGNSYVECETGKNMDLPRARIGYKWVAVETYRNTGEQSSMPVRARPLPGQGIPTHYRVECSESERLKHPVGSYLAIQAKIKGNTEIKKCVYSHHSWKAYVLSHEEAMLVISKNQKP